MPFHAALRRRQRAAGNIIMAGARFQHRLFADDAFALDDIHRSAPIRDPPVPAQKLHGVIRIILDPDVIVLGGGMSNIERLYANVPKLWGQWVFSDRVDTRLVKNRYGDSSGVRGAAWL